MATTTRHYRNKVYQSHFPADLIDIIRRSLAGEKFLPATDGFPVHSFDTLLRELATRCRNTCRIPSDSSGPTFRQLTAATPLQARAFQLLGL
ncbi:MAG: hypothetical protein AAB225_03920 [Acidobacteriota bacterium]